MQNMPQMNNQSYELLQGIAYLFARPLMNHMQISGNIYRIFAEYLEGKVCRAFIEPDVHLDETTTVIPDVVIVCDRSKIKSDAIYGAPDLVAEVLSPSTAKRDRVMKKDLYEKAGVKEYWLVGDRTVETYLLEDGAYKLANVVGAVSDKEIKRMTDEEKAALDFDVKVSLYDDFVFDVRKIFKDADY